MKKLLIANRGEIALRLIRAARDYGIASVAIYADADADALHVARATEAWGLGPGRPAETYLDIGKILDIARRSGADAVHPGYGFLSERAEFAQAVIDAGLIWVGPAPQVITALGDKVEARRIAARVGAPLVLGSEGMLASGAEALDFARSVGLPVAIKAAFGGGGRGMKVARRLDEVADLFDSAVREATEAFGRGDCYAEQFLDKPRHVEAQVIADSHGHVVVLGTRDCSLQRRNQKLVEEAPAPFLTGDQRARVHEAARAICAEAGYTGAGTVEFLLSQDGVLSFLEVNTRLQVEHPVTEETTGVDIVLEQLRIAEGLPLSVTETPAPRGHAIEFRLNAEDPGRGFLPAPGRITRFRAPSGPGVRLDTAVEEGSVVPGLYDSLMAKLIVTGATREQALARARRALAEFEIEGVASVLPFHRAVVDAPDFAQDFAVHTNWIESAFQDFAPAPRTEPVQTGLIRSVIEIDGKRHSIALPEALFARAAPADAPKPEAEIGGNVGALPADAVVSPGFGTLQRWMADEGAAVAEGAVIAVIEAMKMETQVTASRAGRLMRQAEVGATLEAGAMIARLV